MVTMDYNGFDASTIVADVFVVDDVIVVADVIVDWFVYIPVRPLNVLQIPGRGKTAFLCPPRRATSHTASVIMPH